MGDYLPGYDAWKTRAPEDDWGTCPDCSCSQEDASLYGESYVCPECGCEYADDEARIDPLDAREEAILARADL
jgi:hypothetical protein